MKNDLENAIKMLTERAKCSNATAGEALHLTQAALNLAQVYAALAIHGGLVQASPADVKMPKK